jgi:hypothetical protein
VVVRHREESGSFEAGSAHGVRMGRSGFQGKLLFEGTGKLANWKGQANWQTGKLANWQTWSFLSEPDPSYKAGP